MAVLVRDHGSELVGAQRRKQRQPQEHDAPTTVLEDRRVDREFEVDGIGGLLARLRRNVVQERHEPRLLVAAKLGPRRREAWSLGNDRAQDCGSGADHRRGDPDVAASGRCPDRDRHRYQSDPDADCQQIERNGERDRERGATSQ